LRDAQYKVFDLEELDLRRSWVAYDV